MVFMLVESAGDSVEAGSWHQRELDNSHARTVVRYLHNSDCCARVYCQWADFWSTRESDYTFQRVDTFVLKASRVLCRVDLNETFV